MRSEDGRDNSDIDLEMNQRSRHEKIEGKKERVESLICLSLSSQSSSSPSSSDSVSSKPSNITIVSIGMRDALYLQRSVRTLLGSIT